MLICPAVKASVLRSSRSCVVFAVIVFAAGAQSQPRKTAKTDAEIKQAIIAESIADYRANRGNCPCPYNSDRAGHRCGARSAYSRPGGASPICYEKDVTPMMVEEYRRTYR
jgi:hypothetical protein